jgi:pyruvate/2-oxoacid:ferredoxin oxidoreductase alpha subunit/pyruvate/2-oxoacid:ferredoxin oxidoreductase beta subunit
MLRQIEGSRAVAEAVALCRPEVICAYPISPQTHIVEGLGQLVKNGTLSPCEFINVESEFAAMSVAIGASATGARSYTATASQGLLFMAEAVYNASGLGLPIVMTVANRAIGAPINIWNDHSDSMSQRDCGWIQLFAENNQEALDLHIQAFKLAEELSMPVMVCMDGFILTHAVERVDMPAQAEVDAFLPPYEPRQLLDPAEPVSIGAMVGPEAFMEVRYLAHAKQLSALDLMPRITAEFAQRFGRDSGGLVRGYRTEDAETIVVALGSVIGRLKDTVDELRADGVKIGVLGIQSFRPFPLAAVRTALQGARRVVVLEKSFSVGLGGCGFQRRAARLVGPAAAWLHRRRGAGRPRHHQGLVAPHAGAGDGRHLAAADLHGPGLGHRQPPARTRGAPASQRADRREPAARRRHGCLQGRLRCNPQARFARGPQGPRRGPAWPLGRLSTFGRPCGAEMNTPVRFYQTGTFTVGNRLLAPEQRSVQSSAQRSNSLNSGHRACQGCGEALGARYAVDAAMRATNNQLIAANATGCLEVFSTPYPETSWQLPWIHSLFGNAAAVGTGIAAALKVQARKRAGPDGAVASTVRVIAQGGDGGTTDIGFGCLSGMFERNDDVLYICYDNEAYMNTGVQRSSATPAGARTATTQAVGPHPGAEFGQGKNLPRIAMAHEIPYVAIATVADLRDLEAKVERAMGLHGARYLHILVPCPLGWGSASHDTIKLARLACETGIFPVFEAEHGEVTAVTKIRHRVPVQDYLMLQKRFAHLFGSPAQPDMLARIQADADRNISRFKLLDEEVAA